MITLLEFVYVNSKMNRRLSMRIISTVERNGTHLSNKCTAAVIPLV